MLCFQCQETARNSGCTVRGVCGKPEVTANLQDLLIFVLKGISIYGVETNKSGHVDESIGLFVAQSLFATITNANFDDNRIISLIEEGLSIREQLKDQLLSTSTRKEFFENLPDCAVWHSDSIADYHEKAKHVGFLSYVDEDIRALKALIIYGCKGISAYADHAAMLGFEDRGIYDFIIEALAATAQELSVEELRGVTREAGECAVKTMALLDKANNESFGHPEITNVSIGVGANPGILISGHDFRDLEDLLKQSDGTGIDIYTHGEMLPAHYYPSLKKYKHLVGNYGNAWWQQATEFDSFNGPILMTTNCIVPVKDTYRERIFTTGMAGYPGVKHVADRKDGGIKDFSEIIELAKKCSPPSELEKGEIVGGFAHHQVLALADRIVEAVKTGKIKHFVVMSGCDGRHKTRKYYTEIAEALPKDTVILTSGCAKYRYNKLNLGDIEGIPRVLDAGQCNDSYSLVLIAQQLGKALGVTDINDLPLSFDIAWYEQKAIAVLLALVHMGVKNIRRGPTAPGFLTPRMMKAMTREFDTKLIGEVSGDIEAMLSGN
ncbi:MAG: hydroxylamine reductase [Kiritimatiellia bacterium]|jgi:hydroxylamine reductase|nr:hydroxylamine reductase [Kiritimatiellia bacterium]